MITRKQSGLSLIEASMVLMLSAIVLSAAMFYFSMTQDKFRTKRVQETMMSVSQQVNALYANRSKSQYKELNMDMLLKFIPNSTKTDGHTDHTDRLGVKVKNIPGVFVMKGDSVGWKPEITGVTGPYYVIQYLFSPMSLKDRYNVCIDLMSVNYGDAIYMKEVNGIKYFKHGEAKISDLDKACSSENVTGVSLFFK